MTRKQGKETSCQSLLVACLQAKERGVADAELTGQVSRHKKQRLLRQVFILLSRVASL